MRTKRGFTIIELLIAIAIIAVITGIILANYRTGQKQQTLKAEAQKLASTLRQAQNMALAGKTYDTEVPEYGYTVFLMPSRYILSANLNCEPTTPSLIGVGGWVDCIKDTKLEDIDLTPKNVSFSVSSPDILEDIGWPIFVFVPPHAAPITVNYGEYFGRKVSTSALVNIELKLGNLARIVSINSSTGQISVD